MRIAIINPWFVSEKSIGGTERFVKDLAESLHNLGHYVDVYMLSGTSYIKNEVRYISLNLFGKGIIADEYMITKEFGTFDSINAYEKIAYKLEKLIDGNSYDLLHFNSPYFLLAWKDCKRIFTHHSNYEELRIIFNELEYKKMMEITKVQSNNKLTKFVTPSEFYKKQWDLITNNNTIYIPHAIDPKRLKIKSKKEEIIKKYNLSSDLITILLPSRLEPIQKRPMLFLNGCSLLDSTLKNKIQIILTGIDKQYEQYVNELKIYSEKKDLNVKFIKFDSINEGYLIADIIGLPSKSESFGYSALEGLTLGIKTVLTDIPSFREIAEGNEQAVFFDGTSKNLCEKLQNILYNKSLKRRKPKKVWLKKYDINLFGIRYLEVFKND